MRWIEEGERLEGEDFTGKGGVAKWVERMRRYPGVWKVAPASLFAVNAWDVNLNIGARDYVDELEII